MLLANALPLALTCLAQLEPSTTPDPFANPVSENQARRVTPEVIVAHNARPAVVYIETDVIQTVGYNLFGQPVQKPVKSGGSGVVVFEEGFVVTNYHVVREAKRIVLHFDTDLDPTTYAARLVSAVPEEDLALLKIEADGPFPTVPLGISSDLMIAEPVIAIGNPLGQTLTVSRGIVSGLHREVAVAGLDFKGLIQTDASINPGNSGGPLLNINGELIGINTAMNTMAENIGFAIPVDRLRQVLEENLLSPSQAQAWFGFALEDSTLGTPLRLSHVVLGGPADGAGLRAGDELLAINGKPIADADQFWRARLPIAPTEATTFTLRNGDGERDAIAKGWSRVDAVLYERMGLRVEPRIFASGYRRVMLAKVADVRPEGPADRLNVQPGDLIEALRASDRRHSIVPRSPDDLALYVNLLESGTEVEVNLWRAKEGGDPQNFAPGTLDAVLLGGSLALD